MVARTAWQARHDFIENGRSERGRACDILRHSLGRVLPRPREKCEIRRMEIYGSSETLAAAENA